MQHQELRITRIAAACVLLAISGHAAAQQQQLSPSSPPRSVQQEEFAQQLKDQLHRLQELRQRLESEEAQLRELSNRSVGDQQLQLLRAGDGTGTGSARLAQQDPGGPAATGQPAPASDRGPSMPQIFEEPGVLTPKSQLLLEPSLQYSYSSNNRVALVGYTVIPAVVVGLIDVREVKRNTTTAAVTARYGLTNRLEVETRVPYVYRSDSTISRELGNPSSTDNVFTTSGRDIGDVEFAARYQLNRGGPDIPYFIGGLRFKTRTGTDPFEVTTDCQTRCTGSNTTGTGLPLSLPTGSGFYALQPSVTWLLPSDPAVFFGSVSYLHNFWRHVYRTVRDGEQEYLGVIKPGEVIGFNLGVGISLNEKSAVSFGYDHSSVGRTKQNGATMPGSVRVQLGTLVLGLSHRASEKKSFNVSIGAGLTRDTPDLTLTTRIPFSL